MSDLKAKIIAEILDKEGGYVNDPADSGGETNWGITKSVARRYGYYESMRAMPRELAEEIYESLYLEPILFDQVAGQSEIVAEKLVDIAVNMGVRRSGEFLQRALNGLNNQGKHYPDLRIDGDIGPATFRALIAYMERRGKNGETVLFRLLNSLQAVFYLELAERRQKDERFLYGWVLNRID